MHCGLHDRIDQLQHTIIFADLGLFSSKVL
jgi:hypothetical protein